MEIPTIDFNQLTGETKAKTLSVLHEACQNWGFFLVHYSLLGCILLVSFPYYLIKTVKFLHISNHLYTSFILKDHTNDVSSLFTHIIPTFFTHMKLSEQRIRGSRLEMSHRPRGYRLASLNPLNVL